MTTVLESWAVLRYLEDDGAAADAVDALLQRERPVIGWINLGEVFYVVRRAAGEDAAASTAQAHDGELWTGDPELLVDGAPWVWRDLR